MAAITIYCKYKKYKNWNAILYIIQGLITTYIGFEGNFSGIVFIVFAVYIFNKDKFTITCIILTLLTLTAKFAFKELTIGQVVNMLIIYTVVFLIYYILIHPKKPEIEINIICKELDSETVRIIQMLYSGETIKEIADKIYLTESAVTKRIYRANEIMNAKTRPHLIGICIEKGYIGKNMDKATYKK